MNLKDIKLLSLLLGLILVVSGCATDETVEQPVVESEPVVVAEQEPEVDPVPVDEEPEPVVTESTSSFDDQGYTLIDADSCSTSGSRQANVKVDIGYDSDFANRDYYGYTNDYGQLVYVEADEIILQNDDQENSGDDRYCNDEAKVAGTEESDLDEGHVIADSLGGVSNAYNITPQGSQLNRYGTQADIEEDIRSAGGATNFTAVIEYSDTETQIPSTYTIEYQVGGRQESYTFDNDYTPKGESSSSAASTSTDSDVYYKNCTAVRDAGANPIHKGDPGYGSHLDRDGDGSACE